MYFTPILLMFLLEFILDFYEDMLHSNLINVCFDKKSKFEEMMQSGASWSPKVKKGDKISMQVHQDTL